MAEAEAEADPYTILLEEKENAIADLCIAAEAQQLLNVRDCIRKYDPSLDMEVIEREIESCTKTLVVETLDFLGCSGMADYYKEHCENKLICRIQNFMPDNCGICKQRFCIKVDGPKPLLECVMCGQGCHNKCVLESLHMTHEEIEGLSKEETEKLLNPHEKLGVIYMCHACQTLELPSVMEGLTEDGARKRNMPHCSKTKSRKSRKSLEPPSPRRMVTFSVEVAPSDTSSQDTPNRALHNALNTESTVDGNSLSGTATNPVIVAEDLPGSEENPLVIGDRTPSHISSEQSEEQTKPICRYYKRGTCKHGASGRTDGTCPYQHPKYCKKFVMYGNRSPRGCKKGESCDAFHPKICRNSMNDGACYNTSCKHRHLKNTQRQLQIEVSDSNAIHNKLNKRSSHPPDIRDVHVAPTPGFKQTMFEQNMSKSSDQYFLDVLKQFKEEMIATVNHKLKEVMRIDQYPALPVKQPVNHLGQPPHPFHPQIPPYQTYQHYQTNPQAVQFHNQQNPLMTQTALVQQQHPPQIQPTHQ